MSFPWRFDSGTQGKSLAVKVIIPDSDSVCAEIMDHYYIVLQNMNNKYLFWTRRKHNAKRMYHFVCEARDQNVLDSK
jgi:hypothetical protein